MTEKTPDERLIDELGSALESADPVPSDVLGAAKASFTWRTVDAELAELAFDSAVQELIGVRSEGTDRQLTFRAAELEIELMVHGATDRRLTGQLVPPQLGTVELRCESGTQTTDTGPDGVFSFDDVPTRPISLRCTIAESGTTIKTEWVVL